MLFLRVIDEVVLRQQSKKVLSADSGIKAWNQCSNTGFLGDRADSFCHGAEITHLGNRKKFERYIINYKRYVLCKFLLTLLDPRDHFQVRNYKKLSNIFRDYFFAFILSWFMDGECCPPRHVAYAPYAERNADLVPLLVARGETKYNC